MAYGSADYDKDFDRKADFSDTDVNTGLVEQRHTGFLVLTDSRPSDTPGSPVNGGPLDATQYVDSLPSDVRNPFPNAYYGQLTYDASKNRFRIWQPGRAGAADNWQDLIQ